MDIQGYIDSGILEEYFLGMLSSESNQEVEELCLKYPVLASELNAIEHTFKQFALAHAQKPPVHLEAKIWDSLDNLNKESQMDPNNLPLINQFTDTKKWLGLVKPFIPKHIPEERSMHMLRSTTAVLQMFVISKTDFEDETHDELLESFIILEGECECTVGEDVFRVSAGGYAAIPLHVPHTVKILSPYVLAIMQRVAV